MMRRMRWGRRRRQSGIGGLLRGLGTLVGTAAAAGAGWVAYSRNFVDHAVPLPDALPARRFLLNGPRAGQLNYYMERQAEGRPLVLIHSVNAAASAYEMRPLFEHYQGQRPVYALDLPGYGFSDRSNRQYTPELFENAILDLLDGVVGEPADVVALSLGAEFVARAALTSPELFRSLVLISPSGFKPGSVGQMPQANGDAGGLRPHNILANALWSQALFDLIATRRSVRYYLSRSFVGPVPEEMVDYAYATSHQPGAEHAPLYFLSGELFTRGVRPAIYERLELPVLVIYDQDAYTSFETLPEVLDGHPNWQAARITPTRGLPQFDKLAETTAALDSFWQNAGTAVDEEIIEET